MSKFDTARSLALWRARRAWRLRRLKAARKRNDGPRVTHWHHMVFRASLMVARRRGEMAAARPLRLRALAEGYKLLALNPRESAGNNRGPVVSQIIRYAGGDQGEPYCVDALIWVFGHARSKVVRPGFPRAVRLMLDPPGIHAVSRPLPGNIVRYTFDHTGMFVRYCSSRGRRRPRLGARHILALEGNTSATGAVRVSDGTSKTDGYYLKVRPLSDVRDFLAVTR